MKREEMITAAALAIVGSYDHYEMMDQGFTGAELFEEAARLLETELGTVSEYLRGLQ